VLDTGLGGAEPIDIGMDFSSAAVPHREVGVADILQYYQYIISA
jgi:hypothetical protein